MLQGHLSPVHNSPSVSRVTPRSFSSVLLQLAVGLVLACFASFSAHGFNSAPYFPLATGNQWSYQKNGGTVYADQILAPVSFNGNVTYPYYDQEDGSNVYYTNDSNGIRVHGAYYPPATFNFESGTCVSSETDVYSPPIVIATPDVSIGQVISPQQGNVFVTLPGCGVNSYPYTYFASSNIVGNETVVVPLGTFIALKVQVAVSIYDQGVFYGSQTITYWVVPGVGAVQTSYSDGFTTDTYRLTATNVARTAPDPFEFPPQTGIAFGAIVTSNTITVTGTTTASPISITGGQYSINGGAYTSAAGTVSNGQSVSVRQTASSSPSTTTTATLTIGGVSAPFSVTTLSLPSHLLTVQTSGNGTVTSNPAGINCGATCSASYLQGTSVTLTATPGSGTPVFAGWSGGGCTGTGTCTVSMGGPTTVTATFIGDTQAPTTPTGLTATAVSGSQIDLRWNPATDNVGVAAYQVLRGRTFLTTVNAPALVFSDTGLTADTPYSYTVAGCDAAGNCSTQSGSASATTLAAGQYAYSPVLELGFNLISNALNAPLDVVATFGNQDAPAGANGEITANVVSIWKWEAMQGRWAFSSPQMTVAGNAAYATAHNYNVLSVINPGEGYWVNAIIPMTLPSQSGTGFNWNGLNFPALPSGFNLITTADAFTPSQFNVQVSATPPSPGAIPTDNFTTLWAWDAQAATWYFYSPLLESQGGLPAVKVYADSHNFLHFQDYGKVLGLGTGFWVNRP